MFHTSLHWRNFHFPNRNTQVPESFCLGVQLVLTERLETTLQRFSTAACGTITYHLTPVGFKGKLLPESLAVPANDVVSTLKD